VGYKQLQGIETPTFSQRYRYDYRGRRTHTIDILSTDTQRTTENRFDASGNMILAIDAELKRTQYEYDALGRRDRAINPDTTDVEYIYDNRDNLIRVINENNIVIRRYNFDQKNRKTQEIFPGNETIQYFYDANDNLIRQIDAKGQVGVYSYDIANRLETIRHYPNMLAVTNNDPASKTVTVTFDAANRLTGYDDGTTSAVYVYNNVNQKLTETVTLPGGLSINHIYTYYRNGLKRTHTGPDANTYSYTYDAGHRLSSISLPGEGSIIYNRYKWMAPELVTLPGNNTRTNNYDPLMRVQGIMVKDAAQNPLMGYQYSYDMAHNIQSKTAEHGVYTYGYDDLYRLISADNPTLNDEGYTYDDAGNRRTSLGITGNWGHDVDNKLRTYGTISLDYDANGSLTIESESNVVTKRFVYNLENRLSEVRDNADSLIASYYYDPFGRRLWKEVAGSRTYFAYSGNKLRAELNSTGTVMRSYGYAPKGHGNVNPLFVRTGAGYRYYLNDHLATPQQLIDRNGARIWQGRQQAFGATQELSGAGENNLRFPGQYYDAETGLHYNYFRYYDPSIGRYITSDPIGIAGGLNSYWYVEGGPLRSIDPYGLVVKRCYRYLGNPGKGDTGIYNPARHDYLVVNNTTYSFQAKGNFFWSQSEVKVNDENINRGSCEVIWADNKHDKYVEDSINKYGTPRYGIGPQGTDCQEFADDVLEDASDSYDKDNPKKGIEGIKSYIRDLYWYGT